MQIKEQSASVELLVSYDEALLLNNVAGEVLYALHLDEPEKAEFKEAEKRLLELVHAAHAILDTLEETTKELTAIRMPKADLELWFKALTVVCREIDDWEFQTRLGVYKDLAYKVAKQLSDAGYAR